MATFVNKEGNSFRTANTASKMEKLLAVGYMPVKKAETPAPAVPAEKAEKKGGKTAGKETDRVIDV